MSLPLFCLLVQFIHSILHMSEIIWYLSFPDWLISLSIMFFRSLHTVAKGKIFFFMAEKYSIVWMSHSCFIYSSVDGHLGCFHILATVNNFAVNIGCLCSFELVFWAPLDIFPEVASLGQKADPFLIFWGISMLLSTVAAPICIPTNSVEVLPFLHILASTCCLLVDWWWPFWQVWDGSSLWF